MERILTASQMRVADEFTINSLGVSKEELVYRAGKCVADEVLTRFKGGRVLVCIGKGNNGEDGKIIADILSKKHGFTVATVSVYNGIFKVFDSKFDIIIDCILGTGLNRVVEGKYRTAIEKINQSGAYVVACDIASGLNGDNGEVMGIAVKANLTVAIQEYKLGHFLCDGPNYSGEVVAKDIGISIWGDDYVKRLTSETVKKYFIPSKRTVNKGDFGKVAVIGGSKKYSGSVILSLNALTALKMGNGYSNLVVPNCLFSSCVGLNPECILTACKDDGCSLVFDETVLQPLLKYNSVAIGMGVGVSEEIYKIISYFISNYEGTLFIDADGLNTLAKWGLEILLNKKCRVVLTPHVSEFSRLTKIDKSEILSNSINIAKDFAEKYDVTLVLKNAVSVITDGKEIFLNTTGCNGMAKGGSGDVLSGVAVGILAKCEDVCEASACACYLFGRAGEIAQSQQNQFTVTASDIVGSLAKAINSL